MASQASEVLCPGPVDHTELLFWRFYRLLTFTIPHLYFINCLDFCFIFCRFISLWQFQGNFFFCFCLIETQTNSYFLLAVMDNRDGWLLTWLKMTWNKSSHIGKKTKGSPIGLRIIKPPPKQAFEERQSDELRILHRIGRRDSCPKLPHSIPF